MAKERAKKVAASIAAQTAKHGVLTATEAEVYRNAVESLKPVGMPLAAAVKEYLTARKIIGNRSLLEAAQFYKRNCQFDVPPKLIRSVMEEMIEAKRADNLSKRYLTALRYDLAKLAQAIEEPIATITASISRPRIETFSVLAMVLF